MDAERLRAALLKMPHVTESLQWGESLVFRVGDKAIGGKMFALIDLGDGHKGVISYAAGKERFAELVEMEDILPAPYLARAWWVAVERWDVFRAAEWLAEVERAHELVFSRLPRRTRQILERPAADRRRAIAAAKVALGATKTKR